MFERVVCAGGEGSTAREVLKHKTVEKCVMVDIDEKVCKFCEEHLPANTAAFRCALLHFGSRA
jgi:thermospermine synthase